MIPRVGTALPVDGSFGEVIKGTQTMLRAFGWDLGKFYDDKMRPQFGDDWLKKLVEVRKQQHPDVPMYKKVPNLWDPNFCVNEPAKNTDSPLKQCLGPMPLDVWSKFKSIPFKFRNREQHFDEVPALETLRADAELIRDVASFLGLPVAEEAVELIARVDDLNGGAVFGGAPDDMMAELAKELEEYQAKHKAQAAEVAKARATGEAAKADAQAAANELAVMAETIAGLETALEAQRNAQRRNFTDEYLDLAAGDVWPASPPTRTLRLLGHVGDLYDPFTTDLLSNEYGPIAVKAAERWREYLPHGGNVHLSRVGQAVALVNGTWTYLGSLDDGSTDDLLDEVV
ncbi:MAG: hypothetical protein AB7N61_13385 [Acidimicrobiia bacterium]